MTESKQIVTQHHPPGVLVIRIDRPEKKNALTMEMYARMSHALSGADADHNLRVAVIHGAPGCFTSGNDLNDFMAHPPEGPESPVFRFMEALAAFSKPIIAGVGGDAVGIGTTLLLHCDLVYCTPEARFQMPFVPLGLCPEFAASYLLPRMAGYQRAAELLLFGKPFGADQAQAMGLVNAQIAPEGLVAHVLAQAEQLAALPPAAVGITRELMKRSTSAAISQTIFQEAELFVKRLRSPEAREAFLAFFEKRKPDFSKFT